jgi:hypothetical protein
MLEYSSRVIMVLMETMSVWFTSIVESVFVVVYFMKKGNKFNKAALASNHFSCAHHEMVGKFKKSKLYS